MNMNLISESPVTCLPDDVAASIAELYRSLVKLPDLRPGRQVDELFTRLVRLVVEMPDDSATAVLGHPDVGPITDDLRSLASRAELKLENAWARRITLSDQPGAEFRRFPYLGNYRMLCRVESGLIAAAIGERPRSVAFLGCGPLPMTSLVLAGEPGCDVVNIDRDHVALEAAAAVARSLGCRNVRFALGDAAELDLSGFDVVVLAAMVGTTPAEKDAVLAHLARSMRPDAVLLARSAHGMRTLLYPPIGDDALRDYDVRAIVHPVSEVINSVVLARPRR